MIRLLTIEDNEIFDKALDTYLDTGNHEKAGYTYANRLDFVAIHKQTFRNFIQSDNYTVAGKIEDGEIVALAIGYRHSLLLPIKNMNFVNSWHLGFVWSKDTNRNVKTFLFDITNLLSLYHESRNRFSFTKLMSLKTIPDNLLEYVNRVHLSIVPDARYDCYLEALVTSRDDLARLSDSQRFMFPERIQKPLLLLSHSLKNPLREVYVKNSIQPVEN